MARRPIFIPDSSPPYVEEKNIEFQWYPGFAKSQAQKSIKSLHERSGISPILEISGKSADRLGVSLSAFNLSICIENGRMPVECAYQGSKEFKNGGPYTDLYSRSSREAKTDPRLRNSGELIAFKFCGENFPIQPQTGFYNWLYIQALGQNQNLARKLKNFQGFSDIAFNPKRSINCQARAAAIFVSLSRHQQQLLEQILKNDGNKDSFNSFSGIVSQEPEQGKLF